VHVSPYIDHPIALAETLWRVGKIKEATTLAVAVPRGTIEDTNTTAGPVSRHRQRHRTRAPHHAGGTLGAPDRESHQALAPQRQPPAARRRGWGGRRHFWAIGIWLRDGEDCKLRGMTQLTPAVFAADIARRILVVRNERVLLDADLAALYGVSVRRLNERERRNAGRFPEGFLWSLTIQELANLKSQFATSSWGGKRKPPLVFIEHGAVMAATVLNSSHAVQMTIFVVRAFIKTRELLANHRELAGELDRIKQSIAHLDLSTRQRFDQVYEAILGLMSPAARKQ
jgi:hypothetical protein